MASAFFSAPDLLVDHPAPYAPSGVVARAAQALRNHVTTTQPPPWARHFCSAAFSAAARDGLLYEWASVRVSWEKTSAP